MPLPRGWSPDQSTFVVIILLLIQNVNLYTGEIAKKQCGLVGRLATEANMKKRNKYILLIGISFSILTSCSNLGDTVINLGDGYVYRTDGGHSWIGADNIMKDWVYPNVIDYEYNDKHIIIIQKPILEGYKRFLEQELRYRYETIVYKQYETKNDIHRKKFLNSHFWKDKILHQRMLSEMKPDNQTSFEAISIISDSIIKYDPYFKRSLSRKKNYWIIEKKKNLVLGPYSKPQYLMKRKELNIAINLQLKEED